MADNTSQSILDVLLVEVRSLRAGYNEHARITGERLASLEVGMKSLVGNGRKGRVEQLEEEVSKLLQWKWWCLGVGGTSAALVSLLVQLYKH